MAFGEICPENQPQTAAGLIAIENNWATALDKQDLRAIDCILADRFQDLDVEGKLHERNEVLDHLRAPRKGRNHLSELQPHVLGNFGYVRGLNTFTDAEGKVLAKVRFTDIFAYRHFHWEALAGQESLVKESAPGAR